MTLLPQTPSILKAGRRALGTLLWSDADPGTTTGACMTITDRDAQDQPMPVFDRLVSLLDAGNARFRVLEHPAEGQSDAVARIRGTRPEQGAKAMLCVVKGAAPAPVLAVLPGPARLDFRKLGEAVGAKKATLADPALAQELTGCVMGAVPPFALSPGIRLV